MLLQILILVFGLGFSSPNWGFYAHAEINRLAVYSLPKEMFGFYKKNIDFLTDNAVNPDKRRYAVKGEAARHFIDLDIYPDSIRQILPKLYWKEAVSKFDEDSLMLHGIVPWQIQKMKYQLTQAFISKDSDKIIAISADLGHYIADANVPLHTTHNYNGQFTDQVGIHAFWESRLPEIFFEDYDLFIGLAEYEKNINQRAWQAVFNANKALDSVLIFEKKLNQKITEDKKFAIVERNGILGRNYSEYYSKEYHKMLDKQVERQMRASVKMIADIWYSAWVDAGQPDLKGMDASKIDTLGNAKLWQQKIFKVRQESDY